MKNWQLKPEIETEFLKNYIGLPPLLSKLLYHRGLSEKEKIEDFLKPTYEGLINPFLFLDMEKAVARIWKAVKNKEQICVYGDYDADAVTANAVLLRCFEFLGRKAHFYIPDRFSEGYGVNMEALEKIKNQGVSLIITVDCGTNSVDAAEWCLKNGIDLIITDHHEIIGPLPKTLALINPKNPFDNYPYKEITGVGVAFKLAHGLLNSPQAKEIGIKPGMEKWLLDLVAIGTVADCHSLLGENRILVKYGLKVLIQTRWKGLKALCEKAGLDFTAKLPDTYTLGFVIAPRLNAAGRLEHADLALDLLMEDDAKEASKKAEYLNQINTRRQEMTERILSEARQQAELIQDRKFLVLMGEQWSKGVVGLVAGKIAEEFNRPTIILSKENGYATGSARTVGEFSIIDALKHAAGFLERFGGHKQAAGLTLDVNNFEPFYKNLLEYMEEENLESKLPEIVLDAELMPDDLHLENFDLIQQMEPFGVANPRPKFLVKNAKIDSVRMVGAQGQHAQVRFVINGRLIAGIGFNLASRIAPVQIGQSVDLAVEMLKDSWNGNANLKLRLLDFKYSSI